MRRDRLHIAGATLAFLAAIGLLVALRSAMASGNTRSTIAVLVGIGACTVVFVVELMLAATSKVATPVLKTAEMRTPPELKGR